MMKKVLDLKPKDMFYYVFSSYLLIGMHISIEHVGGYGLYLPFNIIGWIFISILIGLGLYQVSRTERLIYSNFSIYCLMGSALMFLPLFYSNNVHSDLAVMRMLGLGGGLLLYLSFQQFEFKKEEKIRFLYVILGSVIIQILLRSFSLFDPEFGAMAQKNVFATFLATGTAIALFLLVNEKDGFNNIIKQILVFSIPFLSCIHIYYLQSRTGYLSLIIGVGFILLFGDRRNKNLLIGIGLLFIGLIAGSITERETIAEKAKQYSGNTRLATYQLTFEMIKDNPVLGVGYGNFLSAFRSHYAKRKKDDPSIETIGISFSIITPSIVSPILFNILFTSENSLGEDIAIVGLTSSFRPNLGFLTAPSIPIEKTSLLVKSNAASSPFHLKSKELDKENRGVLINKKVDPLWTRIEPFGGEPFSPGIIDCHHCLVHHGGP